MASAPLLDTGPLRFLPAALRVPDRAGRAMLVGGALSLAGSILLSALVQELVPDLAKPEFPSIGLAAFLSFVLFAPVVETLIMAGVLAVLTRFVSATAAILASAALWGLAHSLLAPAWGLIIWWPFLIFSTLFVVWRERGIAAGLGVAAATHALQNLIPALLVSKLIELPVAWA